MSHEPTAEEITTPYEFQTGQEARIIAAYWQSTEEVRVTRAEADRVQITHPDGRTEEFIRIPGASGWHEDDGVTELAPVRQLVPLGAWELDHIRAI